MSDESDRPQIKVTDKRHFDRTGEKRPEGEVATDSATEGSGGKTPGRPSGPQTETRSQGPVRHWLQRKQSTMKA